MHIQRLPGIMACALLMVAFAASARTPSPPDVEVYIISPVDGAVLSNPVTIRFGLSGMGVAPAGVEHPNTGHHHLMIDVNDLPAFDRPLPADAHHVHFGGGQTETAIELEPGRHTLQLLFADYLHTPHEPPLLSKRITIEVR